jgi:glycosyltransferase involved in cell wall biosynthesis
VRQGGSRISGPNNVQPLVSVVCVTYNAAKTLPALIESIRERKTNEIEFIIVDGGSTDGTIDILTENNSLVDFWISGPDKGIYDAMNKSLNYAKGKWLIFMGADDVLADGFTDMLSLLKDPDTIYYGNVNFYGKDFAKKYDDYYLTKSNICHQAIFYPRAVFENYKYDLRYQVYADYHLNLQCWKDSRFKFVYAGHYVASFPAGGFSTYTKDDAFENDRDSLFKKYLKPASYYRYLNRTLGFWGMIKRFAKSK